jgi:hypothetical protein
MDVCSGGTISGGVTSIEFTNSNPDQSFTITNCVSTSNGQPMPGWPATDPVVLKAKAGVPGSHVVRLSVAAISGNTYEYTPSPTCPQANNPQIKVQ